MDTKRYAVQDATRIDPTSIHKVRNVADVIGEKYDKLHTGIKNQLNKEVPGIQEAVSQASDYYNNELYKEHPILAGLGATATDELYPIAEDLVTDPATMSTIRNPG